MSSVQERLQLKRTALDKWSVRERLCLASAVACSGDQNWMSVSRTLKLLCGSGVTNPNRPADWFSQKSCAVQYGELLENVETPKRKKRVSESNQPAETPTESILRKLTQERISDLKIILQQEQEEYTKLCSEVLSIENSTASDDEIKEIYAQIEKEQEQKISEKQNYAEWLKKREERKLELQRQWKPFQSGNPRPTQLQIKSEELSDSNDSMTPKQQPGTSPLLTSLLKSPSTTPTSTTCTTIVTATSNVRAAAPTITNLLTGGISTITATSQSQTNQFNLLQTQPLTGPPNQTTSTIVVVPSPSKTAPTLSMLLENKNSQDDVPTNVEQQTIAEPMDNEDDGSNSPANKDELMEVFQGLMDENMDELAEILTNNNALIPEILGEDLENVLKEESQGNPIMATINETVTTENSNSNQSKNEEQSTKQIDVKNPNIIDFDDDSKSKIEENVKDEPKFEKNESDNSILFIENKNSDDNVVKKEEINIKEALESEIPELKHEDDSVDNFDKKSEISDDSVDLTFHEIAEKIKNDQESKASSDDVMEIIDPNSIPSVDSEYKKSVDEESQDHDISLKKSNEKESVECQQQEQNRSPSKQKSSTSESSDVIIIQEDSNEKHVFEKFPETKLDIKLEVEDKKEETVEEKPILSKIQIQPKVLNESTTITIVDTDDDLTVLEAAQNQPEKTKKVELPSQLETKKRESLRIKSESEIKKPEEPEDNKINIQKHIRDISGIDSPSVDEELHEPRTTRAQRYSSSTPVIDSIPNSPASSSDMSLDPKMKKSLLFAYNTLLLNRHFTIFMRIDEQQEKYCLRPMDLQTIKKYIENGTIHSLVEFQRDLFLLCQNIFICYKKDSQHYNYAKELMSEVIAIGGINDNYHDKEIKREKDDRHGNASSSGLSKVLRGSRKSLRLP